MLPRGLRLAFAAAAFCAAAAATADEIEVRAASLAATDEGIVFNGDFELDLTARLEEALAKGVPLYFLVEFECYRPRWYWLDERIGTAALTLRLSFHALTRTYRLSTGAIRRWSKRSTRSRGSASGWSCRAARSSPTRPTTRTCACVWTPPSCRSRSR